MKNQIGRKDMDKVKFIACSIVLLLFTVYNIHSVRAEKVQPLYASIQYVKVSEYSPEIPVEESSLKMVNAHNTKVSEENAILKWSFSVTFILLAISIPCLLILLLKYRSLKNRRESYAKFINDTRRPDKKHNETQNDAINLFQIIDKTMREKKPYVNLDFSRDTMIRMFNTNKNKLNEAIIAGSGMSYSKYICELRLQESIRIMENDSNILLNDLAILCGFNTYSSFYRSFYKRFGMSPADFKLEFKKNDKTSK